MWKFNSFLGLVGVVLVILAGLTGDYSYSHDIAKPLLAVAVTGNTAASAYMLHGGLFCLAFVPLVTLLGMVLNFFFGAARVTESDDDQSMTASRSSSTSSPRTSTSGGRSDSDYLPQRGSGRVLGQR